MKQSSAVLSALAGLALVAACSGENANQTDSPADSGQQPGIAIADLPLPLPTGTQTAITHTDLGQRIAILADDAFEGRAPGGTQGEKTADWIAFEMQRIGLQPAGEDGSWFQSVSMVEQTIDESASGLTVTKDGQNHTLALKKDAVLWTRKQGQTVVEWTDSPLVFVGYGIVAPEYGWNDYAGLDVTGKTVVMLVNDPGFARQDDLFKGKAMTYYGRWTYKFEEAGRQGATGAIVIHETEPASYGWDVVANSWSGPQADLVRADGSPDRTAFESWISTQTARTLFADANLDFEQMQQEATKTGFKAVDMDGLSVSGKVVQTVTAAVSRNVVGRLVGDTAPDEHVLFTAHWDHLGKKTGERTGKPGQDFYSDDIFNGAVDNATGSAALLEIAEAMADEPIRRSALFLAVTLEESGLLGSAYYAENPTVPMNKIVAGINMDGMLPVGQTRDMIVVGYGASELEDRLQAYLDTVGRVIVPDPKPQAGYFYRSDHISFAKKGVPMLYADGGFDKIEGGTAAGQAFSDTYVAQRYHKPMDEYDDTWDLSGLSADVSALYAVGLGIAQSDDWPTWYPGNEFENTRKQSMMKNIPPN